MNRYSVKTVLVFAVLMLPTALATPTLLEYSFAITKEGEVTDLDVTAVYGKPKDFLDQPGDYNILIEDVDGNVVLDRTYDLRFILLTDPPRPADSDVLSDKVPYRRDMKFIKLLVKGELVFSQELVFCNLDTVCDDNENFLTCPADCPLEQYDGVCIRNYDGTCDFDCSEGIDKDCTCGDEVCQEYETHLSCPADCEEASDGFCNTALDDFCDPDCHVKEDPDCMPPEPTTDWSWLWILLIVIVVIAAYYLWREGYW